MIGSVVISDLEKALLKGLPLSFSEERSSREWNDLVRNFEAEGPEVEEAFLLTALKIYKEITSQDKKPLLETVKSACVDQESLMTDAEAMEIVLLIVAKLVRLFVQLNSTGPSVALKDEIRALVEETVKCKKIMDLDSWELTPHAKLPELLLVADHILSRIDEKEEVWAGRLWGWWALRVWFLHQRILDGRSVTLKEKLEKVTGQIQRAMEGFEEGDEDLKTLWSCELANVHIYYYDVVRARESLQKGVEWSGVEFYSSGMMGKKTRFQHQEVPQLVVKAKMRDGLAPEKEENMVYFKQFQESSTLVNVPLNDDTRLEKVWLKESDEEEHKRLSAIQQVLLLSELNFMKKSQPKDELLKEEVLAYVNRLLDHPKLWNVLVASLLLRSTVETNHFRTVERSMMQFENIQKAVTSATSPPMCVRYQFYHATCMPLLWEIDIALAEVLGSLGHTKSALDIYLKLNMWEEVIACFTLLEMKHKAEEVILEEIAKQGELPKLLVYLGDATDDISLYEKAWEISAHKNFLSRQRLGFFWFRKQEYEKAIPYLKSAVELNPLEYPVWIRMAFAALEVENWELAVKSYVHANTLDDESFENWNNLAKAALKVGNKEQALRALKQATKCDYEQWKVWENLMIVSLQCCDLEWTIMSYNRLIDLKGSYADGVVLKLLVDLICDDEWDRKGDSTRRTKLALQKLLGRITSKVTTNADVWQCYSTFLHRTLDTAENENWYNVIQYQQKACRCRLQEKNWEKFPEVAKLTVDSVEILCNRTREFLERCPDHPSKSDFKVQAEFLHKQVSNSIDRRLKEVIDTTPYEPFVSQLQNATV